MENPFKNLFKSKKTKTKEEHKSEKELATDKQLPYVNVVGFELDNPSKPDQGAFELDWNVYFVNQLRKEGYQGTTDEDVVDNWFQKVCKNVALQTWEQYDADPDNRTTVKVVKRDDGKTEGS